MTTIPPTPIVKGTPEYFISIMQQIMIDKGLRAGAPTGIGDQETLDVFQQIVSQRDDSLRRQEDTARRYRLAQQDLAKVDPDALLGRMIRDTLTEVATQVAAGTVVQPNPRTP